MADASARMGNVEMDVAVLRSEHQGIAARVEDYHERLGVVEELSIRMDQKLDAVLERLAVITKVEERLRKLEDWRTGLEGRWTVIAIVGAFVVAIATAVCTSLVSHALDERPTRVAPLDYDNMPVNRDGSTKWPVR